MTPLASIPPASIPPATLEVVLSLLVMLAATATVTLASALRLRRAHGPWGLLDAGLALALMVWFSTTALVTAETVRAGFVLPDSGQPDLAVAVFSTALGGVVAATYALLRARRGGQLARLGLRPPPLWGWPAAVLLVLPFLLVSAGWVLLLEALGHTVESQLIVQEVLAQAGSPVALAAIAYGVLLAPVVEEVLFRGFLLQPLCDRFGRRVGIGGTALAFGLLHFADPASVVPLVFLGCVLAWLRLRTDSLGPPVLLHVANNAVAFGLALSGTGSPRTRRVSPARR